MVFKNPICSLPEVGGRGGRGEGSVSTVTWHWKESRGSAPGFSPSTAPRLGAQSGASSEPSSQRGAGIPGHLSMSWEGRPCLSTGAGPPRPWRLRARCQPPRRPQSTRRSPCTR